MECYESEMGCTCRCTTLRCTCTRQNAGRYKKGLFSNNFLNSGSILPPSLASPHSTDFKEIMTPAENPPKLPPPRPLVGDPPDDDFVLPPSIADLQ